MKRAAMLTGLGVLGVLVGFGLSLSLPFSGDRVVSSRKSPPSKPPRPISPVSLRPAKNAVPEERTLARMLALHQRGPGEMGDLRREMERLGPEELRGRMKELLEGFQNEQRTYGLRETLRMFGEELFRREGEAALEWAEGLDEKLRKPALEALLRAAAAESPAVAKRWIDRLRETYGPEWNSRASWDAMRAAAGRGADDLLQVAALFGVDLEEGPQSAPSYVEDFDFAKMLSQFPKGHGAREAFRYWTAKDKDAAWATMKTLFEAKQEDATLSMGAMWGGVAAAEGRDASIRWLLARLDEIPQDMREATMENLNRQNALLPEDYKALMSSLQRSDDRLGFASGFFAVWGDINEVHAVMEPLNHQERVDVIVKAAKDYSRMYLTVEEDRSRSIGAYFDARISEYSFSPEESEKVREALGRK